MISSASLLTRFSPSGFSDIFALPNLEALALRTECPLIDLESLLRLNVDSNLRIVDLSPYSFEEKSLTNRLEVTNLPLLNCQINTRLQALNLTGVVVSPVVSERLKKQKHLHKRRGHPMKSCAADATFWATDSTPTAWKDWLAVRDEWIDGRIHGGKFNTIH